MANLAVNLAHEFHWTDIKKLRAIDPLQVGMSGVAKVMGQQY
jgi:hypothetical protein